ncbi:hypothetical protein CEXT_586581 [Caerostris extrusa]|uniref:Uncharacterized protein n=1 Tax=Caerostris extrusa TaxID=172846 RepID=A0AAV4RAV9_CAEEX|nr:hypothetical protein CEXT_586581 [Caerostris extrusa]
MIKPSNRGTAPTTNCGVVVDYKTFSTSTISPLTNQVKNLNRGRRYMACQRGPRARKGPCLIFPSSTVSEAKGYQVDNKFDRRWAIIVNQKEGFLISILPRIHGFILFILKRASLLVVVDVTGELIWQIDI